MNLTAAWNAEYIESQYQRWKKEPAALSEQWRFFFEGFELARTEGEQSGRTWRGMRPGRRCCRC